MNRSILVLIAIVLLTLFVVQYQPVSAYENVQEKHKNDNEGNSWGWNYDWSGAYETIVQQAKKATEIASEHAKKAAEHAKTAAISAAGHAKTAAITAAEKTTQAVKETKKQVNKALEWAKTCETSTVLRPWYGDCERIIEECNNDSTKKSCELKKDCLEKCNGGDNEKEDCKKVCEKHDRTCSEECYDFLHSKLNLCWGKEVQCGGMKVEL